MKFIHVSDIHWNAVPDSGKPWSESRKRAIKHSFQSLIAMIEEEPIPLLLISGDLFHNQPLLRDLDEINTLFRSINHTRVVLISGEHDYMKDSSHYHNYQWAENVTFLATETISSVYFPELNTEVHGFSYHTAEITEPLADSVKAPDNGRRHILMLHGGDETHAPFNVNTLKGSGYNYIALGHLHKPTVLIENMAAYPGSLEPLSKQEYGQHGYILGEFVSRRLTLKHVPFAKIQYISLVIHIIPETTNEELEALIRREIERRGRHHIYRFRLRGSYHPSLRLDFSKLEKQYKIVEISNKSEPAYDYEQLYLDHRNDIIGMFIAAFQKPNLPAKEKKALIYGMKALMSTTDEGKWKSDY